MSELKLRREIIETAREMNRLKLNQGTSGNIGVRFGDRFLVTPSRLPYEEMEPEDIVAVTFDGEARGRRKPSSEWRTHRDVLATREEIDVVLHAHSMCATALSCLTRDIPPFHYMIAVAGGDTIRCAPYATFGTQALSDHALRALEGRRACLLANHGMICIGKTLKWTLALAVEVETLAEQYWRALQVGEPKLLSKREMARVLEKFEGYGAF